MDISKKIAELKTDPGFAANVGMVLTHNGVVRGWSRQDKADVAAIDITVNRQRLEDIRAEFERRPGIWRVVVEAHEGRLQPGDDVLFLIVAGDIRENVGPALLDLLNAVKAECFTKRELGPSEFAG